MIICINFVSRAASEFTGAGTRLNTITVLDNETISEANNVNTVSNPNKTAFHVNKLNWTSVLGFIMEGMNVFAHGMSNLPKNAQYLFGFLYLGYAVYVLVMINWAYLTKMSKKQ